MSPVRTYTLFWLVLMLLAMANGSARQFTYGAQLGELRAHQVSTLTLMALFAVAVYLLARRVPLASATQALRVGGRWLVMTVLFEVVFGHYVAGHDWVTLLADYNLPAGRLWSLLLVWILLLPLIMFRYVPSHN